MPRIIGGGGVEQARSLAPRLRDADKEEIFRASGMGPLEGLSMAISGTRNLFWLEGDHGAVEAMAGCSPLHHEPRIGCPWLLGSDFITGPGRRWFIKNTPEIWARVSHEYAYLWNLVDARNMVHCRWLEWSGCRFIGERTVNGNPFKEFAKQCAFP